MYLKLAASILLLAPAAAFGAIEIQWTRVGWYVLSYGEVSEEKTGWLELTSGPYSVKSACEAEAVRQDLNDKEYDVHLCRHLLKPPRPTSDGGIAIWIPAD
jgi:hypothetical protein